MPKDLPVSILDEVSYAFAGVKNTYPDDVTLHDSLLLDTFADIEKRFSTSTKPAGKDLAATYLGNFGEFREMLQHNRTFDFTLSLGGYSGSSAFSEVVGNVTKREDLIGRIAATIDYYSFMTGVSIDWEYPAGPAGINYGASNNTASPRDKHNFALFLEELRCKIGKHRRINVAVTGNVARMDGLPFKALRHHVDQVHLMSYDFTSSAFGDTITSHSTNLFKGQNGTTPFSADEGVKALRSHGIKARQIFIGVPTYSRGFANTDGLGKSCSGVTTDQSWEAGVLDYKAIPPNASFEEAFDPAACAGYAYSAEQREFLSYDTPESVTCKAQYVLDNKLGGILVWAASGDATSRDRSLLQTIRRVFDEGKELS
jgi:chitinase